MNYLRSLVSENRKRYIDNDFNLDLTYITDNIIAMSYPAKGLEGIYRNPYDQVKKFFDIRHHGHYKVYNLRSEKKYDSARFEKVSNYPFLDHQAPPFTTLVNVCEDAASFLDRNDKNVVAIHCKAGKGRTGTVIAALLLRLNIANDAETALKIYDDQRTTDSNGVTVPSQRRYVDYYNFMLKNKSLYEENKGMSITMKRIKMHNIPESMKHSRDFRLEILNCADTCIYSEDSVDMEMNRTSYDIICNTVAIFPFNFDFKIRFLNDKNKELFSMWLNPVFVHIKNHDNVHFKKSDLDIACKDDSCTETREDFTVDIEFYEEQYAQ